jgi:hypothetical protein
VETVKIKRATPEFLARQAEQKRNRRTDPIYKEKCSEIQKKSNQRPHVIARRRAYIRAWIKLPKNRITLSLRQRLKYALAGIPKSATTEKLLGCSLESFRDRIEKMFDAGMTWENYGKWHIDHIIPCSHFDLRDSYQQKLCFHYLNLRPLWAKENSIKHNKLLPELYCETLAKLKELLPDSKPHELSSKPLD